MRQPLPFGKYLLLERISVGGMAEVFKSKAFGVEGFEKIIAIKRILPSIAEDADFITMFVDEAKIAGQLSHANICQIFELGKINESHFIAMEFVWGKDVLQIQNRFRRQREIMPCEMAAFIGAKLCEGLDYAHKKKDAQGRPLAIIHRDVSPQNILVSYEGEVKLIDFGIAKAASRSSKTQAGVLKGKFGYMSPEQVRGLPLDRRSDLFAVGTILYELLTGERLFLGESDFSTLEKVRNVDVKPPSTFNKSIPPQLEKIVMKALARDVEDRYAWAAALQEDLITFVGSREPVFTAKTLSAWMKDSFNLEMERERGLLEQYKKVGKSSLNGNGAPGPRSARAATAQADPPSDDDEVVDRAEATLVGAPTFGDGDHEKIVRRSSQNGGTGTFGDEAPTEIFGEVEGQTSLPAAPTAILEGGSSASSTITDENPTIVPAPAAPAPRAPSVELAPQMRSELLGGLVQPAPKAAPPAPTGFSGNRPAEAMGSAPGRFGRETAAVARLEPDVPEVRRGSLLRDVFVGVAVALIVLAVVGGGWMLLRRPRLVATEDAVDRSGTIAIAASDTQPATIFVNGESKGTLTGGEPLKIEGLEAGIYEVVVKRTGAKDCLSHVALEERGTEVVMCRFETAVVSPRLLLTVVPDGVTVFVDRTEISDDAAREPILLSPDVPHEILAEREGYASQTLQVTLAPGESVSRSIELVEKPVKQEKAEKPAPEPRKERVERPAPRPERTERTDHEEKVEKTPPKKPEPVTSVPPATTTTTKPVVAATALPTGGAEDVGYLIANTTPWARVWIDNKDTGKMTPIAPRGKISLKPGRHNVTFVIGEKKFSYPIVVEAGKDYRLIKKLPTSGD